jgi:ABC-type antimicrobial peptide transport system permease subunit
VLDIFGRALLPLAIGAIAGSVLAAFIDASIRVEDVGGKIIPGIVPAAAVFMMLVGTLALAGPARRAVRIDPSEALRTN